VYGTLEEEELATMLWLALALDARTQAALLVVMPVTGADSSAASATRLSDSTELSTSYLCTSSAERNGVFSRVHIITS
jgi:hypothetical protein